MHQQGDLASPLVDGNRRRVAVERSMRFMQPAITTREALAKALNRAIQWIRHKGEFNKEIGSKRQGIARRTRRKSGVPSRNPYA